MGYTVQIQRKRDKKIVLDISQTFDRLAAAQTWEKRKKDDLAEPGGLDRAIAAANKPKGATLGDAIDRALGGRKKGVGKTTVGNLKIVKTFPIAQMPCEDVESHHIRELAELLAESERSPQTVGNILSSLGKVFTLGRPMWNLPLNEQAMGDALVGLRELGLIKRSSKRKRRPTLDELDRLMNRFVDRARRANALPMHRITAFAIFSTRRLGEICRLQWDDFEEDHEDGPRILVRDMKHPGEKRATTSGAASPPRPWPSSRRCRAWMRGSSPTRQRRRARTLPAAARCSVSRTLSFETHAAMASRGSSRWTQT